MKWKDEISMSEYLKEIDMYDSFLVWKKKKRYNKYYRKTPTILCLPKKVLQFTRDWDFVKEWESSKEVSEKLWIKRCSIINCINWKAKSAWFFVWKYK